MAKKIAQLMVDTLVQAGVERVYGLPGDSLNGFTDSIRKQNKLQWIHVRHEESAASAAGAEAHLTGRLAVCAGSCGPGNMHLVQWALRLPPKSCASARHRSPDSKQ
jgi:pyruvate dehydrogenase (quinone)